MTYQNLTICNHLNFIEGNIRKFLIIFFLLSSGCYLPSPRDDFSVLGNDVFSNILRESYSEKLLNGSNGFGVQQIDKVKANKLTKKVMLRKSADEIMTLIKQNGGQCSSIIEYENKKKFSCNVEKTWRLKNIGANFDASNWSEPAAKMRYQFVLNNFREIANVEIEIIDITQYKSIYTR